MALLIIVVRGPTEGQSGIFGDVARHYIEETSASVAADNTQLADINSLMEGNQGPNPESTSAPSTIQETSLQASDPASTDYIDSFKADQVIEYTVQSGDSIGSIAVNFGVSINTIIWANNIRNPNVLSSGQVLKIPPVTGVIHTVQAGDTIASIAKKYKADTAKILTFNNLQDGQALQAGNELMVPDGEMPGPKLYVKPTATGPQIYVPVGDGQCVAFVQAHGFSNLHGNAYQWAKYINGQEPQTGGVVVLKGGRFGHIALITAVTPSSIQVVEQNYYGLYVIDHREISLTNRAIVGFIR